MSTLKKTDFRNTSAAATKTSESSHYGLPPKRPLTSSILQKRFDESPLKTEKSENNSKSSKNKVNVSDIEKNNIIAWIEELGLIRPGSADSGLLMNICRTGVLYADLVNRLEGKIEVVKVERNPRNRTQALSSLNKVLEYLRGQEKMKSRFLWASKELVDGDEFTVWGLLSDIRSLYSRPTVNCRQVNEKVLNIKSFELENEDSNIIPEKILKEKSRVLRSYSASMRRTPSQSPLMSSSRVSRPESSKSVRVLPEFSQYYICDEFKKQAMDWVQALGIEYVPTANAFTDSFKNGILLCELVKVLELEPVKFNPNPRNSKMISENFFKALSVFNKKKTLPNTPFTNPSTLSEHPELIYTFLYNLKKLYPKSVAMDYQDHPLPYGALGIQKLEKSITNWIISLNILHPDPLNFHELIPEIKSGVLLCVVVSKAFNIKIPSIIKDPKTELSIMNNIRKALDLLRKIPEMSQKYLYSAKEIYKGCTGVILGLFEDMHRCFNGLPARKNADDYNTEGPYLPETMKKKNKSLSFNMSDSFNTTFGSIKSPKKSEMDPYAAWISELGVKLPNRINFLDDKIPEFTTGVILCNIVEEIEQIDIHGVEYEPRSRNAALGNFDKALKIIKAKKMFPSDLKNVEEELFRGNGVVIRKLLQELRKWGNRKT